MVPMTSLTFTDNLYFGPVLGIACETRASVYMVPMRSLTSVENIHFGPILGIAYEK